MTPSEEHPIDVLVTESRALREAVHTFVARMRCEQQGWRQTLLGLTSSTRLTGPQRRQLRSRLRRGEPR